MNKETIEKLKQELEIRLLDTEGEIAMPPAMQYRKEFAGMYEDMVNPEKIEERRRKKRRKDFVKNRRTKFCL